MVNDASDLRFFVTLSEAGSLAEAARRLDVTPSAVSQHLRQLESRLGLVLVRRSTRRFSLTDEGELFYAGALDLLARLDLLTDNLRARASEVAGNLNLCGPLGFGRHYLAQAVAEFHALHPKLLVSLNLTDVVPAADARGFDLIVHIGDLPDSSRVACPLAPNERFLCASPDYVARRGMPAKPEDLAQHDCLVLRENQEDVTLWRFTRHRRELAVRVPATLCSNDGEVVKQWALLGKGILLRSEWDVADCLREGRLVRLLPEWQLPPANVVALLGRRGATSARVRLFLSFLQARFQPVAPWRAGAQGQRLRVAS
ncbi:LysR family transcriptional regulator [Ramlibacter alkalitolerans]|uniref:LysR family transcriptional regulator n=1 Tax=Ramlibacter alkalitolerans TaxID=2039631 RepID=A0ABS1JME7_9BURK|nr:LysR family transcriptional regulator [Ramlibacter alkalitolerans]MBL0425306.1 LysR family transcriptional regulator [Ramlibacter alkalitolerans]